MVGCEKTNVDDGLIVVRLGQLTGTRLTIRGR